MAAIGSLAHAVYPPRPIVYPYSCLPCLYSYCLPYPVDGVFEPPCAAHPSRTRGCEDEDYGIRTSGEPSQTTPKPKHLYSYCLPYPVDGVFRAPMRRTPVPNSWLRGRGPWNPDKRGTISIYTENHTLHGVIGTFPLVQSSGKLCPPTKGTKPMEPAQ